MITLDGSAEVLRVEMTGAPATTQPDFKSSWDDNDDANSLFTFGETDGVLAGVTPVVLVPAPAAGVQRNAKRLNIFNADTAAVTLLFSFFDGVNARALYQVMLDPDWSVAWECGGGWTIYDQNGIAQGGAGGVTVHNDLTGRSVADTHPASSVTNTPAGDIAATEVQAAIDELDAEKAPLVHAANHEDGGSDELEVETQPTTATDTSFVLKPDGAGGLVFGSTPAHAPSHENGGSDEISVAGLSGELADDQPPKAHDIEGAKHTLAGATAGEVLAADSATTFSMQSRILSKSGVYFHGGDDDVTVWRAPFACTVTNVRGFRHGGSAATINARRNGSSEHLSSDLSLGTPDVWADGGAVQNTAYVAGDSLEFRRKSATGKPVITVQVDFTRP